jgi:hypothetical protein
MTLMKESVALPLEIKTDVGPLGAVDGRSVPKSHPSRSTLRQE